MKKIIINKEIKEYFEEELQTIMQNNHKELQKVEWELALTKNELDKANDKIKKLKDEKKELEKLIKEYDKGVYDEYRQRTGKNII